MQMLLWHFSPSWSYCRLYPLQSASLAKLAASFCSCLAPRPVALHWKKPSIAPRAAALFALCVDFRMWARIAARRTRSSSHAMEGAIIRMASRVHTAGFLFLTTATTAATIFFRAQAALAAGGTSALPVWLRGPARRLAARHVAAGTATVWTVLSASLEYRAQHAPRTAVPGVPG